MRAPDVERLIRSHRSLTWIGMAVVIVCVLIGLAIGLAFWGWPQ